MLQSEEYLLKEFPFSVALDFFPVLYGILAKDLY